ncbi:MAG TPA: DHA2 family efflux MFS transporter permease subunit [Gaiellaceae bacterium]|jgi:EmrB/QacA subfamily drug resistance transporter|nr:DHA2 family efflux MFS transporter permease subunit [Gaiellaceae bacterium]
MFHPVSSRRRWSALALIVTAQFMVILDVAIVNVALPSIKSDLGFSETGLQWVITAYAILFGGTLLLGGRLADLLGRRRMFVAGLALFALSSLLSGFAWSAASLVGFRAVQGLGGALLAPAALSLLMTTFAEGRERNLALGIYGAASGSGAAAGVLLGGVITSYLGWSWIFFVNVPVGVAAIALTPYLLRESRADLAHRHFDLAGATSVTAGLMLLVYGLTRATSDGWSSPVTLGLLGGAAALVAAFVAIESRSRSPLLPLRIFRLRALSAANATMALVGAVTFSEFFLLTLYVQDVLHYSAVQSGVAFVAFAFSVVVASNLSQAVVGRVGIRGTLTAGLVLATVSLGLLTRVPVDGHYFWDLFPAFVLGGTGLGFSFVPVTIASLSGVGREDAGVASGLVNTSRQIGGAIGLAAVSTVAATAASSYAHAHSVLASSAPATVSGFQTSFDVLGGLLVAAIVIVGVFLRPARERVDEAMPAELQEAA